LRGVFFPLQWHIYCGEDTRRGGGGGKKKKKTQISWEKGGKAAQKGGCHCNLRRKANRDAQFHDQSNTGDPTLTPQYQLRKLQPLLKRVDRNEGSGSRFSSIEKTGKSTRRRQGVEIPFK